MVDSSSYLRDKEDVLASTETTVLELGMQRSRYMFDRAPYCKSISDLQYLRVHFHRPPVSQVGKSSVSNTTLTTTSL